MQSEPPTDKPVDWTWREHLRYAAALSVSDCIGLAPEVLQDAVTVRRRGWGFSLMIPRLNMFRKQGFSMKGKPTDLATQWADQVVPNTLILGATADGTEIRFDVNIAALAKHVVPDVIQQGTEYGTFKVGNGQHVIVEYSSPNIAKPFHAGHLRSTMIGNFMKHLYRALGYKVTGINYLGDWGKQYGLLAVGWSMFGNEEELEADPIKHLFHVYVSVNKAAAADPDLHEQARAYFARMEQGSDTELALWKRFRDLSVSAYKNMYARLNVEFDEYSGESMFEEGMRTSFDILSERNVLTVADNGAHVIDLKKHKLGVCVVKKADGATLYITRDIAAARHRWEKYAFDKMFYVVAAAQDLHFGQLFKTLDLMGCDFVSRCTHVNFGMVLGMSTRRGEVTFLSDILDEAQAVMLSVMKSNEAKYAMIEDPVATADIVGVSAVVVQDFAAKRIRDYTFDLERCCQFEGDTGPYLQYAHARLASVVRKALAVEDIKPSSDANLKWDLLVEEPAQHLVWCLLNYPAVVLSLATDNEPVAMVMFLFELGHAVARAHEQMRVINSGDADLSLVRLTLFEAARQVLSNGLTLLGLQPLQRM